MDEYLDKPIKTNAANEEGEAADSAGFSELDDGDALGFDNLDQPAGQRSRIEREQHRCDLDQATREFGSAASADGKPTLPEGRAATAKLERIKQELNAVPALPGVYLWKDKSGQVIYVGKAKQLRARMRQYVNFQDERAKIPLLVDQIDSFDYIVVENEHESLVLEKNLINHSTARSFSTPTSKTTATHLFIALTKGDVFRHQVHAR